MLKRFHFKGHTKGFIYKLKTLLRVSPTDFGSERVIKSCLFFQSSHMNFSTKSASYPGQFALSEFPEGKLDRWRHIRNRRWRLGTRLVLSHIHRWLFMASPAASWKTQDFLSQTIPSICIFTRLFILSGNFLNELQILYPIIFLSFIDIAMSLQCTQLF